MNLSKDKVTEIFYFADIFCKEFYKAIEIYAIEEGGKHCMPLEPCRNVSRGHACRCLLLTAVPDLHLKSNSGL